MGLRMRGIHLGLVAALLFGAAAHAADTSSKSNDSGTSSKPSVIVATVSNRDVAKQRVYVGRVNAINTVNLTARVEGTLEQRNFKEGGFVKKGDLLFVIEQAAYKAAVAQSKADVASTQAQLKQAEVDYERDKGLAATNDITQQALDAAVANRDVAKANVQKAQAGLAASSLNLGYTEIHSPIAGRISAANVDVGNLVGPSAGPLATIVSLDPIYVTFFVSERDLIEARKAGLVRETKTSLTPHLELADGSTYPKPGTLDYVGIEIGQGTDTIEVRAVFDNPNHILIPGQFVNVTLRSDKTKTAVVVPQIALQNDQTGSYVLVVNQSDKVVKRSVKLGEQVGIDWVVEEGLKEGERVIVQGIQKVHPGVVVNPVQQKKSS